MPPHDAHRIIQDTLAGLPLRYRLAHLATSTVVENGERSVAYLIEVALIMAKHLPENERTSIVWHLNECAEELKARWN
jgi:hypothetical protein